MLCLGVVAFVQKINQKNTWELNLIDHLTEIIKVEEENDMETNFQKVILLDALFYSCERGLRETKNKKKKIRNYSEYPIFKT